MFLLVFFLVFDQLDVVSYEEVVRLPAFKRKTLVLIGNLVCHIKFCNLSIPVGLFGGVTKG